MKEQYLGVVKFIKMTIFMGNGSSCFKYRMYRLTLAVDFI